VLKNRHRTLAAAAAALLACAAPLALSMATMPAQAASATGSAASSSIGGTAGLAYVALGDSYASGYGLEPVTDRPVPGCAQSSQDYPHRVASALGLALTDVTCSGAVIADITSTAQATDDGTAAPQDSALSSRTRIVTLTIGGNDLGFTSIAAYCVALSSDGPLLTHPTQSNCHDHYTAPGADNLQGLLADTVSPALTATLAAIHGKAPHAKVFVIGYPALAPNAANTPAGGCFRPSLGFPLPTDGYPFTSADVPFLLQTEQALDAAISADAQAAGDTFVPTLQATLSHTPCAASTQPAGTPWMNGLSLASLFPPDLQAGALHPDAAGVSYMASELATTIKTAFPTSPPVTSSPVLAFALTLAAVAVAFLLFWLRARTRVARRGEQERHEDHPR